MYFWRDMVYSTCLEILGRWVCTDSQYASLGWPSDNLSQWSSATWLLIVPIICKSITLIDPESFLNSIAIQPPHIPLEWALLYRSLTIVSNLFSPIWPPTVPGSPWILLLSEHCCYSPIVQCMLLLYSVGGKLISKLWAKYGDVQHIIIENLSKHD